MRGMKEQLRIPPSPDPRHCPGRPQQPPAHVAETGRKGGRRANGPCFPCKCLPKQEVSSCQALSGFLPMGRWT